MIKSIKHSFKCVFNEPSVYEVAKRELEHVRHSLLEAQTAKEYAEAMVISVSYTHLTLPTTPYV